MSLGISQIDNAAEVGSMVGSSASGLLQSVSSLMGPTTFGIGGGMQNIQGGPESAEASHAGSTGGLGTMFGGYSRSGHHGPNSTADSSVHKLAMTPGSVLSMAPRESRDSGTTKGTLPS